MKSNNMVFLNSGWMTSYDGIADDDIKNGGAYIKEHGFGGEVYNFRNDNGNVYGYAQMRSNKLNIDRVSNNKINNDYIKNVTCVFVARHPEGGRKIVGWYENATLYRNFQMDEKLNRKDHTGLYNTEKNVTNVGYYAVAKYENSVLLLEDERLFAPDIPSGVKGGFGQSQVWYADSDLGLKVQSDVLDFIKQYSYKNEVKVIKENNRKLEAKRDIERMRKVELIAVEETFKHYENMGYIGYSVESENKGWDLEFKKDQSIIYVEVKGLSSSYISINLSRNEYEKMEQHQNRYRLSIVSNCLESPTINIVSFNQEKNLWEDQFKNKLKIHEILSARCTLD